MKWHFHDDEVVAVHSGRKVDWSPVFGLEAQKNAQVALAAGMGESFTFLLYRCRVAGCGRVKSRRVEGEWTLAEARGEAIKPCSTK